MLRVRLGLRLGPFLVTSSPRRRPRVPSVPGVTAVVLAAPFAVALGIVLAWWWSR